MAKFIGFNTSGVKYPPFKLYDAELVRQDLLNHFLTRRGERIMNPEFGTRIYDLLMDPFDEITQSAIYEDVIRVIETDPRVTFVDATVQEFDQGIIIEAVIEYHPDNVKDTLYLQYLRNQDLGYF